MVVLLICAYVPFPKVNKFGSWLIDTTNIGLNYNRNITGSLQLYDRETAIVKILLREKREGVQVFVCPSIHVLRVYQNWLCAFLMNMYTKTSTNYCYYRVFKFSTML